MPSLSKSNELQPVLKGNHFPFIFLLFLSLRLTVLLLYQPEGIFTAYTDYSYYFRTAKLSDGGFYPFINMWYEYPPVSTYVVQAVYWLSKTIFPFAYNTELEYVFFRVLLGCILLAFDCGVLLLVYRISSETWGYDKANLSGWVYACIGLSLFYWSFSHHIISVFFFLLSLHLFLQKKDIFSAIATGIGTVTKIYPIILIPVVIKFFQKEQIPRTIRYGILVLLVVIVSYMPFVFLGGQEWILGSFTALGKVRPYLTIWAIIDGNWGPGNYGPLNNRLDLSLANIQQYSPTNVPFGLVTIITALIYSWFWIKPINEKTPKDIIRFSTLSIMVFHLWSKGWSPQWASLIVPLLLITFPGKKGIIASLTLNLLVFIEWPLSGYINSHAMAGGIIIIRSLFFLLIFYWCAKDIWSQVKVAPSS